MNSTINKKRLSVIYIIGGKYSKKIFKKSQDSVKWADEIVRVEADKFTNNFAELRNIGAKMAKCEWILYIDTDEVVSDKLRKIILESIETNKFSAYALPRRNFIFGREMKHCGQWPDYVLRLIKKNKLIYWQGDLHEQPQIDGNIHHLTEPLIHIKHNSLNDMVDKTNKWSEIEAQLMFEANHPPMNIFRFVSAGLREFWLRMVVQKSFMEGTYGIIYGLYQVFSRLISYSKLWELQLKSKTGDDVISKTAG